MTNSEAQQFSNFEVTLQDDFKVLQKKCCIKLHHNFETKVFTKNSSQPSEHQAFISIHKHN